MCVCPVSVKNDLIKEGGILATTGQTYSRFIGASYEKDEGHGQRWAILIC
jgi:hypothetical protein